VSTRQLGRAVSRAQREAKRNDALPTRDRYGP
jgi:hypothetical protein